MIKVQARVCHVWAILAERGRETWWSLSTSDIRKTGALCKFSFKDNLVAWRLTSWSPQQHHSFLKVCYFPCVDNILRTQCKNLAILLPLWFYVKSILADFWRQGPRRRLGSRGLSPGTFWDLLNGPFFQIAQKCNKKIAQKNSTPLSPGTFS